MPPDSPYVPVTPADPARPADPPMSPADQEVLKNFIGSREGNAATKHPPVPGLEFLGIGYDAFGRYASVDSCRRHVLDFSGEPAIDKQLLDASLSLETLEKAFGTVPMELKLTYSCPEKVQCLPRFELQSESEFDSTLGEQITKWSAHANLSGSYGLFSGEIDARFSSNRARLATTKFYSLASKITYWQLSLNYGLSGPLPVAPDAQRDIDAPGVTPKELFDAYGTHYLSKVAVGCKVTISSAIDSSRLSSEFDFGSYLNIKYGGSSVSGGVTTDATHNEKVRQFNEHSKTRVSGAGISDEQLAAIQNGTASGVTVLSGGWHHPALIDFPQGALVPIWTLCTEQVRRDALRSAFDAMAAQHATFISGLSLYVPIYLYRAEKADGERCTYRPAKTAQEQRFSDGGLTWELQNRGRPIFNAADRQLEGTLPLRIYRFGKTGILRYETSDWDDHMAAWVNEDWHLVSDAPLCWVIDPGLPNEHLPAGSCPVFAYTAEERSRPYVRYYSTDASDRTRAPAEAWKRHEFYLDRPSSMSPNAEVGIQGNVELPPSLKKLIDLSRQFRAHWYGWKPEDGAG